MSKRPKTGNAAVSRLRRPAGRLRDLPIWSKLGLIMLVPTLATIIVGVSGLVDHINEANNAERARTLAALSQAAGGLVDRLQNERSYAVLVKTTPGNAPEHKRAQDIYKAEWANVDTAKNPYAQQRAALDSLPAKVDTLLTRLDRNLEDLPATRTQSYNAQLSADEVEDGYGAIIDDLLNVRDASAQLAADTTLSDRMRAAAAVARAKDYIAQQRDVGYEIVSQGDFNAALRRKFLLTVTGYEIAQSTLQSVGTDEEQQLFTRVVAGPQKRAATNYTEPLQSLQGANTTSIPFNRDQWQTAMVGYNGLFRNVETQLDARIVKEATALRDEVNRKVFIETSVLLGLLLLAILFAWLVARSMARSLRELRQGALSVAQFGLPHAVNRLRDPTLHQSLTPAQVADQVAEPLPVRSRDEFGQVTEAFNAVHLEAVRTAAEQAALRSSVATMFVNLARRSQILVDRLIGHLDRLERGEEDPDRLAELFQLDHLATRMRRNDENLLVLAGADSTRVQREPAALIDVLRAAQSEVEHYTRIEFGMIDRDIEVAAHAVNDMVHLVAELFDNATAFSPPNSTVLVEARHVGDGAILSVEDRGIGISREQLRDLNERLANPPMVDVAVSRMMGLVVVARLAARHGVKVELRPADTERGTVADVGLPATVLVSTSIAGRLPAGATAFGGAEPAARPQFAEPLALESGRGGYGGGRPFDPNPPMPTGGMLGTQTGRSVPAWSDLTGAPASGAPYGGTNGGTNGYYGPPQGPPPVSERDTLPRRTGGDGFRPDGDGGGFGATIPRQLPANPESQGRPSFVPPVSAPPLPPYSGPPMPSTPLYGGSPPVPSAPPASGPPASGPTAFAPPMSGPPMSGPPMSGPPMSGPPMSGPPAAPPPLSGLRVPQPGPGPQAPPAGPVPPAGSAPAGASAPPTWPPVADRDAGPPAVPESLAAALDMTAELPRYRPDRSADDGANGVRPQSPAAAPSEQAPETGPVADEPQSPAQRSAAAAAAAHEAAAAQAAEAQATAAAQIAAAQAAARQRGIEGQYGDETMELPIFRELESAWFTTARPHSDAARPADQESVATTQRISTGVPQQASSPESMDGDQIRERDTATVGAAANPWQTVADEGWQAARAAADRPVDSTTTAGLPKRTPMAQLVPGGVDRGENSVSRRTPETVRGLLSAYHRGVQRGRQSTNPEETPGGQQASQAGKEHDA
ncbi:MAG TPA: nitrate- and nitrite sensing domain-containing protein [Actinoplanes sp.]